MTENLQIDGSPKRSHEALDRAIERYDSLMVALEAEGFPRQSEVIRRVALYRTTTVRQMAHSNRLRGRVTDAKKGFLSSAYEYGWREAEDTAYSFVGAACSIWATPSAERVSQVESYLDEAHSMALSRNLRRLEIAVHRASLAFQEFNGPSVRLPIIEEVTQRVANLTRLCNHAPGIVLLDFYDALVSAELGRYAEASDRLSASRLVRDYPLNPDALALRLLAVECRSRAGEDKASISHDLDQIYQHCLREEFLWAATRASLIASDRGIRLPAGRSATAKAFEPKVKKDATKVKRLQEGATRRPMRTSTLP